MTQTCTCSSTGWMERKKALWRLSSQKPSTSKRMKKAANAVISVKRAISAMAQPQLHNPSAETKGLTQNEGLTAQTQDSVQTESPHLQSQHPAQIEQGQVELELFREDMVVSCTTAPQEE